MAGAELIRKVYRVSRHQENQIRFESAALFKETPVCGFRVDRQH